MRDIKNCRGCAKKTEQHPEDRVWKNHRIFFIMPKLGTELKGRVEGPIGIFFCLRKKVEMRQREAHK